MLLFFVLQTYAADMFFAQEHSYSWPAAFSWYISSILILFIALLNQYFTNIFNKKLHKDELSEVVRVIESIVSKKVKQSIIF